MKNRDGLRMIASVVLIIGLALMTGPSCGSSGPATLAAAAPSGQQTTSDPPDNNEVSVYNVTAYGAVGDGLTDNTKAIAAATSACLAGTGILYFPPGTFVAQSINWSGMTHGGCRIEGAGNGDPDGSLGSPVSVIQIRTNNTKSGIGIDLSGSSSIHIGNIGFQGGTSVANAPEVLVLMGKTAVPNSDANDYVFDCVTFKTFGRYELYDYGSEVVNFNNSKFFGESFAQVDLVTLSAVNSAGIVSPNTTLRKPPVSMTAVNFTGQTSFETTGGKLDNQVEHAVVFDEGNPQVTGGVAAISFAGTTFLLYGLHDVAFTDPVGATGPVSHISIVGVRAEGDGGTENQLINLHTHSQSIGWTITGQWGSLGQTVPEMQFVGQLGSSYVNWNSQDSGPVPVAPTIEAGSGNGTTAIIENGSNNPISGPGFTYAANGSPTYNFQSIATGAVIDPTSGKPALDLSSGVASWQEAEVDKLITLQPSGSPFIDAKTANIFQIPLSSNVTSSTLSGCFRGTLITIDVIEDSAGDHTWTWPTNIHGGGQINNSPNEHNVQSFYCDGTNAWASSPMVSTK